MAYPNVPTEYEEGWNAPSENIADVLPKKFRRAISYLTGRSKWFDRVLHVLFAGNKAVLASLREDALWTDVRREDWFTLAATGTEQPPQFGVINDHEGAIFMSNPSKDEVLYFKARAKHTDGKVRLKVTTDSAQSGDIFFSVQRAVDLNGPWTTNTDSLTWDSTYDQDHVLEIDTGTLTVGETYYYAVTLEHDNAGYGLADSDKVLVADIQSR